METTPAKSPANRRTDRHVRLEEPSLRSGMETTPAKSPANRRTDRHVRLEEPSLGSGMETTPAKSPVTYKRRRSRTPLSELRWNGSDVDVDPESAVSLLASDDEEIENVTPVKQIRKRGTEQPISARQTRSSKASGGDSVQISRVFGTLFGNRGKEKDKGKGVETAPPKGKENVKGKGVERTPGKDKGKDVESLTPRKDTPRRQESEESPVGGGPGLWHSPIEFVQEKRAMFAEIDAFELESEEEELEPVKCTGKEMASDSSGETISLESSKGETSAEPPNTKPEQSAQDVTSSRGEKAVQTPPTRLEKSTEEVTITVEVGEKDDG